MRPMSVASDLRATPPPPAGSDVGASGRRWQCNSSWPPSPQRLAAARTTCTPQYSDSRYTMAANAMSWHAHQEAWSNTVSTGGCGGGGGRPWAAYHVTATATVAVNVDNDIIIIIRELFLHDAVTAAAGQSLRPVGGFLAARRLRQLLI